MDGRYIGYLSVKEKQTDLELGIHFVQNYRGHGYGPEAIIALTDYLYQNRNISSMTVRIEKSNGHSIHMFEKLGAQFQAETVEFPNILDLTVLHYEISLPIHNG